MARRIRQTRKRTKKSQPIDWIFIFKYAVMDVSCDPEMYNENDQKKIQQIVRQLCKEIWIDKTYVDFEENKHEKIFMLEKGWNKLCKLVTATYDQKSLTRAQNDELLEAYKLMIICYLNMCLTDLGYDISGICIQMQEGCRFMSEVQLDTMQAWQNYPGRWQTWECNQ